MKKISLYLFWALSSVLMLQAQDAPVHEGSPSNSIIPAPSNNSAAQAGQEQQLLPNTPASAPASAVFATVATSMNYVLRAGDLLRVEVFQEPDLTKDCRIAGDGTVVLPLIGSVKLGGFTVGDATVMLRDLYSKDYLVNPQVTLMIQQYGSRLVYVHGQTLRGSTPVQMPPEGDFMLTQAISAAGGISLRADSTVTIKRVKPTGGFDIIKANIKEIYRSDRVSDIPLKENDVIFVDESWL